RSGSVWPAPDAPTPVPRCGWRCGSERPRYSGRMADLHELSAVELLDLYQRKAASPVEATRDVLRHIARWEPLLHATYALDAEAALIQAEASQARWIRGEPL